MIYQLTDYPFSNLIKLRIRLDIEVLRRIWPFALGIISIAGIVFFIRHKKK
jgi:hypothetical protein